jgi:hypothetical protein
MIYDPKDNFHKFHGAAAEELRRAVHQPSFQTGISFALAEMGTRDVSKEQMEGASLFIETLLSIGEKNEAPRKFPEKRLEVLDRPSGDSEVKKPAVKKK